MASTTTSRPSSTPARRSPPVVSAASTPAAPTIPRGATARAAASTRLTSTPASRRASLKGTISPPPTLNGTRESLVASLKQETEDKEKLLVQLQDKDQTITGLKTENDNLSSALHAAETRLAELYTDQGRMEEDLAARHEVIDKLRSQVRELEKEKRDIQRRYNEQTATFEAERQAFYDNEQHLKSRIQSLSQARKQSFLPIPSSPSVVSIIESEADAEELPTQPQAAAQQDLSDPEQEPAEMTALRLELSTLSTSHTSLQSTLMLLQSQLNDLKRVNHELQEENESYNILLREKTLNGQFDVLRMGGTDRSESEESESEEVDDSGRDVDSLRSRETGRSTLDRVDELAEEHEEVLEPQVELDPSFGQLDESASQDTEESEPSRRTRKRSTRNRTSLIAPRGESLANLPITGPGLDLAAELGRAENKDILDGHPALDDRTNIDFKRKGRKVSGAESSRKVSTAPDAHAETISDLDALRNEVKSLKDANKALSLYASKIIDRIISQEGFEHVLAADYEKSPTPSTAVPLLSPKLADPPSPAKKPRPQTVLFSRSTPATTNTTPVIPQAERLTTFESLAGNNNTTPTSPQAQQPKASASARASRRSLSFDWKSFSMFGGTDKKPETPPHLRPLTLKAGTPVVTGARKLDTQEDDEDRKERERLNATMKLMGIEKPVSPMSPLPPMLKSFSTPAPASAGNTPPLSGAMTSPSTATAPTPTSRFSFFRRTSSITSSETSSVNSGRSPAHTPNLTHEALEQAEAENSIAALEAHERQLSAEIAKGAGGGFTEIVRRSGDRRSSRRSGSGSTVFSAGMSKHEDDD